MTVRITKEKLGRHGRFNIDGFVVRDGDRTRTITNYQLKRLGLEPVIEQVKELYEHFSWEFE